MEDDFKMKTACCYSCGFLCEDNNFKELLLTRKKYSNKLVIEFIANLIGDNFVAVFKTDDVICENCFALINTIDYLELKLQKKREYFLNRIIKNYNLNTDIKADEIICDKENDFCDITKNDEANDIERNNYFSPLELDIQPIKKELIHCSICDCSFSSDAKFKHHFKKCELNNQKDFIKQNKNIVCKICKKDFFFEKSYRKHYFTVHHKRLRLLKRNLVRRKSKNMLQNNNIFNSNDENCSENTGNKANNVKMRVRNEKQKEEFSENENKENSEKIKGPVSKDKQKESPKKVYHCEICKFETPSDLEMKNHISSHTKEKYACKICQALFKTRFTLEQHRLKKHSLKRISIKCELCSKIFKSSILWKNHMRYEHDKSQYLCIICQADFNSKNDLEMHLESHATESKRKCHICSKEFLREVLLRTHLEYGHRLNFECKYCLRQLSNGRELRIHERRHERTFHSKMFKCAYCNKILKSKGGFASHLAKHTGDFKLFCEICGRGFMSLNVLKEHMGVHTKEDRYVCDICGQKFCFKSSFRIHRIWHENPKPYSCMDCNLKFTHTSLLAVHRRRVHTGERPYVCNYCQVSFACTSSLKRHKRLHTGERPHICSWCSKGFLERKMWVKHLVKEHEDYSEMYKKRKCEYKIKVRSSDREQEVNSSETQVVEKSNYIQEYIIVPDSSQLENAIFYERPQTENQIINICQEQVVQQELKFSVTEGFELISEVNGNKQNLC